MPGKTAKSAPLPPFGLSGMTALVRADTLSCENAGKSQKCTQDRESSGESRVRGLLCRRKIYSRVMDTSVMPKAGTSHRHPTVRTMRASA
jgi:hypothetical protein